MKYTITIAFPNGEYGGQIIEGPDSLQFLRTFEDVLDHLKEYHMTTMGNMANGATSILITAERRSGIDQRRFERRAGSDRRKA